ncbi:hypothetical protein EXS62_02620 [Candidatus Kaiserbacteria bacterium]|nr:hypothetical protein [Candidatus Kaiserbacteria bacterium]
MKKSIITIVGFPGSGKSSTARGVAEVLGYERFSSGDLMRQIGAKRGLSIEETNTAAETDPTFDQEVDEALRGLNAREKLVVDSRIAYHWLPDSFKVLLKLDPVIGAQRVFSQLQKEGRANETASSLEEVERNLRLRIESECKRYQAAYGVDYRDEKNFDLIVDTAAYPLEGVVRMITEKYIGWINTPG